MRTSSLRTIATLTVVAALSGGGLATAPAALAVVQAGPLGIGVARTDDAQRGIFTVPVWTDDTSDPLSTVTATVRDGDTVIADGLALTQSGDTWQVPSGDPLKLAEDGGPVPHLGHYAIDVTATDDQGHTITRTGAGTLDFTLRPELTGTALTQPALDFDHRSTAVTGTLVGIQPGSGDTVPLDGTEVTVTRKYTSPATGPAAAETATTAADGTFTSPAFTLDGEAGFTTAFSADTDQVHGAASADGTAAITTRTVYVAATADRTRAVPGQTVTVSGTVHTGGTTSTPVVAGAEVTVELSSWGGTTKTTVTTDANGAFSAAVPAVPGENGRWTADVTDPYLDSPGASGGIILPDDSSYTGLKTSIAANGMVTATGTLVRSYDRNSSVSAPQVVHLEYSKDGKTGWGDFGTATQQYTNGTFSIGVWGHLDGYYRVHHYTSDQLAESISKPVRLYRINTHVYSNNASPANVNKGATVTVTGVLKEHRTSAWTVYKSQHVELFFEKKGTTKWIYITSGKTDSHGKATLKGKATADGVWLIQYFGDSKHFNSDGTPDFVNVR
ncbi:hypothetical protein [Actinacidiphila oryziradicis]|uniref:hypothetical protein n=1 Tax=Actinacidiphila oryziradicis TaxID=2571141 RepID=UPI0023F08D7F|nr:hypothetical protein [Actinacidiphila oryziradicis]MCW2869458.1 hypothetical protein [Actinacidiphila oryziradicis]